MATTVAGKSPNTTPTKWNKRLQKPMGNFTSVVNLAAKLLSACERTSDSKVTVLTCHITSCSFIKLLPPVLYSYKEMPWEHSAKIYWRFLKTQRFNLDLYLKIPQRHTIFLSLNMRFYASHLNLHLLRNSLNFLMKLSSRTSRTNLHVHTNSQKSKVECTYSKQNVTSMRNLSHQSDSIDILFDGCSFGLSIIRIHMLAGILKIFSVDTHTKDTTVSLPYLKCLLLYICLFLLW